MVVMFYFIPGVIKTTFPKHISPMEFMSHYWQINHNTVGNLNYSLLWYFFVRNASLVHEPAISDIMCITNLHPARPTYVALTFNILNENADVNTKQKQVESPGRQRTEFEAASKPEGYC